MHAVSKLDGLICAFTPNGDNFALGTPDGRVRTYDTASGKLRVDLGKRSKSTAESNGHLTERNTCIAWLIGAKDKSKRAQLAVGTAAGDVKLFDTAAGELKWKAVNCVEGGVSSVAYCGEKGEVLAAGASCQVSMLAADSGSVKGSFTASKHAITSIAVSPDQKHVLAGGSSLALWELASQARKSKFSGHPTAVRTMAFSPDGSYAVSAAISERSVAVWYTGPVKKAKKLQVAAAALAVDDAIASVDVCGCSTSDSVFFVAAVSEHGDAYVWRCQAREGGEVDARLLARLSVGGGAAGGEAILAAKLHSSTEGPVLLLARGTSAVPAFERINIPAVPAAPAAISLAPATSGALLVNGAAPAQQRMPAGEASTSAPAKKAAKPQVTVVGPDNMGETVMMRGAGKRSAPDEEGEEGGGADASQDADDVPQGPEDEVPLGERVAALEARLSGEAPGPSQPAPTGPLKADSVAVLLTQAIRSGDRSLLENVLSTTKDHVINNTVRRLLPMDAAAFLQATVERMQSRPVRAATLLLWIRAVLLFHTAYLMSAPGVQGVITSLYQTIESRLSMHRTMLSLSGRLDLLMAQVAPQGDEADADGPAAPLATFEDDEDEPEAEDAFAPEEGSDDEDESEEEGEEEAGDGEEDDDIDDFLDEDF